VSGRSVKVELICAATDTDTFKLVEVANHAITDTGADRTPKGGLAIVEAEFYEAPPRRSRESGNPISQHTNRADENGMRTKWGSRFRGNDGRGS
jgi:hypothetical protein